MEQVDCVVIGAGVVGLAIARALALAGREVLVLERASAIGTGTSSRNSEVIHAGIYYPQGSLKARLCVEGRRMLYAYCRDRGVACRQSGKLIVATSPGEAAQLPGLLARAQANEVEGMRLLSAEEVRNLEPQLACSRALLSQTTGIIDSHAYMLALQGDAEAAGAMFAFFSEVSAGRAAPDGVELNVTGAGDAVSLCCRTVVNAAGLGATALASRLQGMPPERVPRTYLAKGSYFMLAGRLPFTHLVYPLPAPGGLGVHLTMDLGGQGRFGPDVEWVDHIDYRVDPQRSEGFYEAVRRYWPALADGALVPGYSGIRPKISPPGAPAADFVVQGTATHGVPGLVNLFGIESPGLTASLALAAYVCDMVQEQRA